MLYKFEQLDQFLDKLGFPEKVISSGFQIIRKEILENTSYADQGILFEDDKIYIEHNGKKYQGYMFIKEAWIEKYNNKFPKFHLIKCETIERSITDGKFSSRYHWSNSSTNNLIDKGSRKEYEGISLQCCKNCRNQLLNEITTTEDFYNTLDKADIEEEVDIFGYPKDQRKISKQYRGSKNYTCESCKVKCREKFDRRWWHTHHKDGKKTNNVYSNLECLCILCHANKDDRHKENFRSSTSVINTFRKEYRNDLIEVNNPYLGAFEK